MNFQIKRISHIRDYIPEDVAKTLVTSLVLSKIDYCNSLLAGITKEAIYPIQKVQNNAARLIFRTRKREHITPLLVQLHWLPVRYRIEYKILIFCYKAIHGLAPAYLSNNLTIYEPTRTLRSSGDKTIFKTPNYNYKRFGFRSFYQQGPFLWNKLPLLLRNEKSLDAFKRKLKHHLFLQAY